MMRNAWITGARGFIGQYLSRHLAKQGLVVSGIGHGHWPPAHLGPVGLTHWSNAEITAESLGQLEKLAGRPDVVFHLAGGSSVGASVQAPYEDYSRTVSTTARLLEWLRVHAPESALVVASSAAVYGGSQPGPAIESSTPEPVSPYGYHKWMMEQLCREYASVYGVRAAVLRLFSVYGEGLRKQLLWDCGVKLLGSTSIELGGTGEELRDWVYAEDAAAMLWHMAGIASNVCPVINGGSGVATPVRVIVKELSEALGSVAQVRFSGISRAGDPRILVANVTRLTDSGFTCKMPVSQGIGRYAAWFGKARDER